MEKISRIKNSLSSKVKAILFGIILTIIILELSLDILNKFVEKDHKKVATGKKDGAYNILCVGDSFTYGVGAKAGYTYPEQLQRIFHDSHPEGEFYVINSGVPGFNSSQMLKKLPADIINYYPNLIIIWGGVDNCWNFTDTNYFICTDKFDLDLILRKIDSFLLKFRTYKLFKISILNLNNKIHKENETRPYYLDLKTQDVKTQREFLRLARVCIENNRLDKGVILENLKMAYNANKDPDDAIRLLKLYYPWEEFSNMVIDYFKLVGEKETVDSIYKTGIYKGFFDFNLNYKNNKIFDKLLLYDLENMIICAKSKNIKVMLLTYPSDNMERGGDNFIIRMVADKYTVPCVDIAKIFSKLLREKDKKYYFVPDGHFNDKGYKVIAEEIYKKFKSDLWPSVNH